MYKRQIAPCILYLAPCGFVQNPHSGRHEGRKDKEMANNNIIELVNVTKSFDGDIVLDNINLKIKDGE